MKTMFTLWFAAIFSLEVLTEMDIPWYLWVVVIFDNIVYFAMSFQPDHE